MIVDLFIQFLLVIIRPLLELLPEGNLDLPDATAIGDSLAGLDDLIPILGVLRLGAVLLSGLAFFFVLRAAVFLRYLLLP